MTHDWYDFDQENNMRVNKIRMVNGLLHPFLCGSLIRGFSTGFRFNGSRSNIMNGNFRKPVDSTEMDNRMDGANLAVDLEVFIKRTQRKLLSNLWSTNASFSFAYNNANQTMHKKRSGCHQLNYPMLRA